MLNIVVSLTCTFGFLFSASQVGKTIKNPTSLILIAKKRFLHVISPNEITSPQILAATNKKGELSSPFKIFYYPNCTRLNSDTFTSASTLFR